MKYLAAFLPFIIIVSSCSSSRKAILPSDNAGTPMAVVFRSGPGMSRSASPTTANKEAATEPVAEKAELQEVIPENEFQSFESKQSSKKAHSFAEMKEMVRKKELQMSKKDQKVLAKMDRLYKRGLNNHQSEPFELTTAAMIIGGIGIIALIIALFGSFFFAFIFLLALAAFILRWIGVINF